MNHVSDDATIIQFYDQLFEIASSIIKRGETHAPIVLALNTSGGVRGLSLSGLHPDERASLFFAMAARPEVRAAALIIESWYVEGAPTDSAVGSALELAQQGRLYEHPARQEAIVVSIMTSNRQAVMVCPIDRATNSLQKRPFQWLCDRPEHVVGRYIRSAPHTMH